ncbi:MAG: hypothetical protein JXA89_16845 [Anaerolineae bacterium]|nr:hypothetical protein [Anaerolineae bacterium]
MSKLKRFLILAVTVLLLLSLKGHPGDITRAQEGDGNFKYYFPTILQAEPVLYDDFADEDPEWMVKNMQSESDTFFRHERGLLYAEIRDNADRFVAYPGWRPQGDFRLEVRASFDRPDDGDTPPFQTRNGLGLVFGASDDWTEQYAYMLGYWGVQHAWALIRYDGKKPDGSDISKDLSSYGGAPWFVKGFDSWNHLSVRRVKDLIYLYCNGHRMPMPEPYYTYIQDGRYGTNRLVGLTITSWEASYDRIEFDDFKLTPLSMPY